MSTARVWDSGAGEWLSVTTGGSPVVRSASPPSRKDVIWVDTSDTQSGAVPGTIFGAKGEILVGTGAGTYEALPAAPGDGYGITSDSSQSGGVAWVAQAARFKVGSFTCPGSTGNKVVSGLGFKPGMVTFAIGLAANTEYVFDHDGAMDASGNQWSTGGYARPSVGVAESDASTTRCINLPSDAGTGLFVGASYVSMDTDGFTINFSAVNTAFTILWKAFR